MIVNAAIFTCSICGEPSTHICAYCTKDACGNHRCVRCKRCSDCCECEFPLSAEEAVIPEAVAEPAASEPVHEPLPELFEPEVPEIETPEPARESSAYPFLTPEESSVFAEEDDDENEPRDPTDPVS
jgi:hypothetical protein